MILPLWRRQGPDKMVEFHNHEQRIKTLELALEIQKVLNKAMLAYVEADISSPWMMPAKDLSEALREALKE